MSIANLVHGCDHGDRRFTGIVSSCVRQRLVHCRIELLTGSSERLETEPGRSSFNGFTDGLERAVEFVVFTRTLEVIKHRQ